MWRRSIVTSPASQRAEEALLGVILREPEVVSEIVGAMLEANHFYFRPYRLVFEEIVERYYGDESIDALLIAERIGKRAAASWGKIPEREAVDRILALRESRADGTASPLELAKVVKRHADYRRLLTLSEAIRRSVEEETDEPDMIASAASTDAMKIATDRLVHDETLTYLEQGKRFVQTMKRAIATREAGIDLGVKFGLAAIDDYTRGLLPGELMMLGGPQGVGKSALAWHMARRFARAQAKRPVGERVGTLIGSFEMPEVQSSSRMAQMISRIEGEKLRMGTLTREELNSLAGRWAGERDLPLYTNFAGFVRHAQMRAIASEAVRKHNVGLIIIDHFGFLECDERGLKPLERDDETVIFLRRLALDLNCVVICLAHTIKGIQAADKRPTANELRGSGKILHFADFIALMHRPYKHASRQERDDGTVTREETELIWDKTRYAGEGTGEFYADLSTMTIRNQ
jgi:replicative DNA helicase